MPNHVINEIVFDGLSQRECDAIATFGGLTVIYDGDDEDAAVAACQADYEARIRSALVNPAAPVAEAGAVVPAGWRLIETAPNDGQFLFLGIARRGFLEEIHIGRYSWAVNEDEENVWWSEQADDEICPTHWAPFIEVDAALQPPARENKSTDELIDLLTDGEGDSVTFCSPNPDFNGLPNECVTVNASWTNWSDHDFRADTRQQCLMDAVKAAREIGEDR